MPAPVKDIGVSVVRLLKDGRIAERADDVRREAAGGWESLDLLRAGRNSGEQREDEREAGREEPDQ